MSANSLVRLQNLVVAGLKKKIADLGLDSIQLLPYSANLHWHLGHKENFI